MNVCVHEFIMRICREYEFIDVMIMKLARVSSKLKEKIVSIPTCLDVYQGCLSSFDNDKNKGSKGVPPH